MSFATARLRTALDVLSSSSPTTLVERIPLDDLRMLLLGTGAPPGEMPIPARDDARWQPIAVGARWGAPDVTVWFYATARVPERWRELLGDVRDVGEVGNEGVAATSGRYAVALRLLLGVGGQADGFGWPEGLLYVNGQFSQGINRHHQDVLLRPADVERGELTFDVRAWSGLLPVDHRIAEAAIALVDREAEALSFLLREGADLVDALGEREPLAHALLQAMETAADALDPREASTAHYRDTVAVAREALRARLVELRAEYQPAERPSIVAVGHGHLDVAWLWQLRHTREKTARTFGIATALMEQYPEYVFLHTTPQVFAWLKDDYPAIYDRVIAHEREGRFEVEGAMWLESDCNLVSGEALVRQIAHGQRFMQETFGHGCEILWLPDAFGYSAALPQIMLRAGLSTFVTTKMSWSETNRIPMDTFRWRGLDGSAVLAHFITTPTLSDDPRWSKMDTYNGSLGIKAVLGIWDRYRQKAINSELVLAYGYGDGGAGPTRQMIEQVRAIQELPGAPELRLGRADVLLRRVRARVWGHPQLPTWDGEMYLEYHRGTYTTQAWLKRAHRRAEANLLLAELLDAWTRFPMGPLLDEVMGSGASGSAAGEREPAQPHDSVGARQASPASSHDTQATLDAAWRTLLLHEFHDILPGSSIHAVYQDAREAFTRLHSTLDTLIERGLSMLVTQIGAPSGSVLVFNPSPWPRTALVELPAGAPAPGWVALHPDTLNERGEQPPPVILRTQEVMDASRTGTLGTLVEVPELPRLGYRLIARRRSLHAEIAERTQTASPAAIAVSVSAREEHEPARADGRTLENGFFRVELDETGAIASFLDKRVIGGRELFRSGQPGNQLVLFDDRPAAFDAWNIDASYEARSFPLGAAEIEMVETGPLRATIRVVHRFGASTLAQYISVYSSIARVDFATRIDWHERHRLLKASFPLDLRTTQATYEVQYGSVERATHRNTSWDEARFEVWAHRWVDVSESDYGASLLNDGRYGHDVHDTTVRISLARGPTYPDPEADQGEHDVTYSLYPHLGDWRAGGTVHEAYALNRPARILILNAEGAERTRKAQRTEIVRHDELQQQGQGEPDPASPFSSASSASASAISAFPSPSPSPMATPQLERFAASLFSAEPEAVVIEAVKRADDGDGLIVRLYEAHGGRHTARIRSLLPLTAVEECDLLERPLTPEGSPAYEAWQASSVASHDAPVWEASSWSFMLRPFEIRTFRVRMA